MDTRDKIVDKKSGFIYAAVAALIWSSGGVFIKIIDAPGFYIAGMRSLVAGLVFLPFVRFGKIRWSPRFILLIFCYAYTLIGFVIANKLTTAVNAITLQYTSPIWLFILYSLLAKKVDKHKLLPIFLATIGIIIFLFEPKQGTNILGNLIALSTGVAFAGVAYFSAMDHGISRPGLISICNLSTFVLALPFIKAPFNTTLSLSTGDIIGILILGSFQIGIGYLFYMKSLKLISPLDTSLVCLLEPIANPIWVLLFIGETPTTYAIVGSVFVIAGITANIIISKKQKIIY